MKKLIAGNWKMNGDLDEARALVADIINRLDVDDELQERYEFLVCPPVLHIGAVRHALYGFPTLKLGAQDCSAHDNGAHTGDVSAAMLKDAACSYVIVGHSERRADHGEGDADVKAKAEAVLANDMVPIICVGETLGQREAGEAEAVVSSQLKGSVPEIKNYHELVIAYEPVWAIGTGKVPGVDDIQAMHGHIRNVLSSCLPRGRGDLTRILYGGSLKPDNAAEILMVADVDGGLIGGASLTAESFLGIARAGV